MYRHCHIGNDVTDLVFDEITSLFQGHEQHLMNYYPSNVLNIMSFSITERKGGGKRPS